MSLGGGINFITHTGYSAPGSQIKLEGGSFGWQKQTLRTGGVVGDADYFVSVDNARRDGYQDYTFSKSQGVVGNFGYRFSPKLQTRLIVRYREEFHENAGALTRAQLKHDSTQTNAATRTSRGDSHQARVDLGSEQDHLHPSTTTRPWNSASATTTTRRSSIGAARSTRITGTGATSTPRSNTPATINCSGLTAPPRWASPAPST